MNGGNFLVSLKEVLNFKKILLCKSFLKEKLSFGDEELGLSHSPAYEDFRTFTAHVCNMSCITCHESASCSDINVP